MLMVSLLSFFIILSRFIIFTDDQYEKLCINILVIPFFYFSFSHKYKIQQFNKNKEKNN